MGSEIFAVPWCVMQGKRSWGAPRHRAHFSSSNKENSVGAQPRDRMNPHYQLPVALLLDTKIS